MQSLTFSQAVVDRFFRQVSPHLETGLRASVRPDVDSEGLVLHLDPAGHLPLLLQNLEQVEIAARAVGFVRIEIPVKKGIIEMFLR